MLPPLPGFYGRLLLTCGRNLLWPSPPPFVFLSLPGGQLVEKIPVYYSAESADGSVYDQRAGLFEFLQGFPGGLSGGG